MRRGSGDKSSTKQNFEFRPTRRAGEMTTPCGVLFYLHLLFEEGDYSCHCWNTDAIAAEPAFGDVVLVVGNGHAVADAQHVQQIQIAIILHIHIRTQTHRDDRVPERNPTERIDPVTCFDDPDQHQNIVTPTDHQINRKFCCWNILQVSK